MASKKDMRRPDLAVPFVEPQDSAQSADMMGTMSQTLPMAAIFTRNKMIGWVALVLSLQGYLAESAGSSSAAGTSGIMGVGMSVMALGVCYMQLFMPQPNLPGQATGTGAPAAQPA